MVPKDLKLNERNQTAAAAVGVQVPAGNRISRNGLLEQVTRETAGEILSSIIEHVFLYARGFISVEGPVAEHRFSAVSLEFFL